MRVVVSNPDGIGDVVLRLPMMRAIVAEGHALMVVCRGHAQHFVRRGLGAAVEVVVVREDPYVAMRENRDNVEPRVMEAVGGFLCEEGRGEEGVLVFGSYQWTILEERLAGVAAEGGGTRVRMNGFRYLGRKTADVIGTERVVEVEEGWHEAKKNEALCVGVLGKEIVLGDPELRAEEEDRQRALAYLAASEADWWKQGQGKDIWTGVMGNAGDYYSGVKEWGEENWLDVIRHLVKTRGASLVLTGAEAEQESLERLRLLSGVKEGICIVTGDAATAEGVSMMLGLTSLATAYIGKDTGPMHVAAALGKPVISVFGGGHWPRFTPMVTPSLAVAVEMPCSPCGWLCHLSESFCVKMVPPARVISAIDAVIKGSASRRAVELLPRTSAVLAATSWEGL